MLFNHLTPFFGKVFLLQQYYKELGFGRTLCRETFSLIFFRGILVDRSFVCVISFYMS